MTIEAGKTTVTFNGKHLGTVARKPIHSDVFYMVSKGRIEGAIQLVENAIVENNELEKPDEFASLHYPILRRALDSTKWLTRMLEVGQASQPVTNFAAHGKLIIDMANPKNGLNRAKKKESE